MAPLVEIHERPALDAPVFLIALDGWVDAGRAMARARKLILDTGPVRALASFDTDLLIDFRTRRPAIRLVDGVVERVGWPQIELVSLHDDEGRDAVLLHGLEPDHRWHSFTEAVVELIVGFGSRLVVSLGGYPGATPHTRPVQVTAAATDRARLDGIGHAAGAVNTPAGIQTVIEQAAAAAGVEGIGIFAQVPHYAVKGPYPAAARALIETVGAVAGLRFDPSGLEPEEAQARRRLDKAIARSEDNLRLIKRLEEYHDRVVSETSADLPSGDEIAAQLEEFLRNQRGDD